MGLQNGVFILSKRYEVADPVENKVYQDTKCKVLKPIAVGVVAS